MKLINLVLGAAVLSIAATATATPVFSCQKYAEVVALNTMNRSLIADQRKNHSEDSSVPKNLPKEDYATLQGTVNLDKDDQETNEETGVFGISLGVMEECLDGLKVETKIINKNGKAACQLIKVGKYFDRDCG